MPEGAVTPSVASPSGVPARLKTRPDFLRVAAGGRVHARCFSLQVLRRSDGGDGGTCGARVGLTVTKKVGGAVERNRIKRRLREALRTPGLAAAPDHDYVIVARQDALTVPFSGLVTELKRCFGAASAGRSRRPGARRKAGPQIPSAR